MEGTAHGLTSAALPGPGEDEPIAGEGPLVITYLDLGCPHCAAVWTELRALPLGLCFRHFPVASKHPRAPALHAAAEAAREQSPPAFIAMIDLCFADQGRQDDPHLWERASRLGLDIERFEADRRSPVLAERVSDSFRRAIRGGVAGSPSAVVEGHIVAAEAIVERAKSLL